MENDNKSLGANRQEQGQDNTADKVSNPFESKQPVTQDSQATEEVLENEQQFKEAQTERD